MSNGVVWRQQYIKRHKTILSTLTAHIEAIRSRRCVACVLTANEPCQGLNGIDPRPALLGTDAEQNVRDRLEEAASALSFCSASECDCCVHICLNEPSQRRNASCFGTTSPISPGVKAPSDKSDYGFNTKSIKMHTWGPTSDIYLIICHVQLGKTLSHPS